jgi:membrane-associated phospholipid phosphatase
MKWQLWLEDIGALGTHTLFLGSTLLCYLAGNIFVAKQLLVAYVVVCALTVITRLLHFKQRPDKAAHKDWMEKIQAGSFPSGHASRATSLFVVVGNFLSAPNFLVVSGLLILAVAGARIKQNKHDIVDAVFGIILGAAVGMAVILMLPTG